MPFSPPPCELKLYKPPTTVSATFTDSEDVDLPDGEYEGIYTILPGEHDFIPMTHKGLATIEDRVLTMWACDDGCPPDPAW